MKKTLALILSLLVLAVPSFALELDVAEGADVAAVEAEATLSAGPAVPASVAKYDATYGELIYFEDFEDNSNVSYTNGASASISGMAKFGQEANGNRYGIGQANMYPGITDPVHPVGSKLTVKADLMLMEGVTSTSVNMWGYGTSEMWPAISASDATTTAWVTKAKTLNGTSALNGGKQLIYLGSSANFYWDNIAIYAKYDMASDKIRLVEGTDYSHVALTEQTYTFPAPADTAFDGWISADGAVYEVGKTVNASEIGGKTFTSYKIPMYAEQPADVDLSKGILVFFDNGNETDYYNNTNLFLVGQSAATVADGYHTRGIWNCGAYDATTNPTGFNTGDATHGIAVRTADGSAVAFADGTAMNGTISVYFEMYNGTSADKGFYSWSCFNPGGWEAWCGGYTAWSSSTIVNKAIAGTWTTIGAKLDASKGSIGLARNGWDNHNSTALDIRSAYVYYMPNNRVTVDGTLVDLTGKTEYTLPAFDTADYDSYKDADGNVFVPGTYAVADINGKVFTPYLQPKYSAKPADFSHGRGILVYFDNGNEADFYSNMNATLVGYKNTTDADGYFTRDLGNPAAAGISGTVGIGLDTGDSATKLAYADGTDMKGAIYLVVDMYNDSDSPNRFYRAVRTNGWDGWCGIYTDWRGYNAAARTWSNVAEAFDTELSFIGFADTDANNWQASTFRSVYAYYMPNTRVALDVSGTPEIIDLTGKTEYTFPEITDGVNNVWKDSNGVCYFPGDVAAVEDINTNTFFASNFDAYAPEAAGVEMRLTANTAKNGIRFKAALAPSKKAEANEAGFIVARAEVLEKIGQDLTFDLSYEGVANAEGTLFVKGVAYNKAEGKNIVADILADGSEVYTGVCVGMDIENKAHVTSTLVARPYVKLDVAGNEITVYGAEQSASLYELVSAVKETEAYEGAKQYIDTVIATAEAN